MEKYAALVPNAFYDVLLYVVPTSLAIAGLLLGSVEARTLLGALRELSLGSATMLLLATLMLSYQYGRVISVLSGSLIKEPMEALAKRGWLLKRPDFMSSFLAPAIEELDLEFRVEGKSSTDAKWVLMYFAFKMEPPIGADLMKRYARERLSRSAALTCLMLGTLSLLYLRWPPTVVDDGSFRYLQFGTLAPVIFWAILAAIQCYEYYRRRCYQHAALVSVVPILKRDSSHVKERTIIVPEFTNMRVR